MILICCYECIIRSWNPSLKAGITDWQKNLERAEEVIYSPNHIERLKGNVIVGSSLARRLVMDTLSTFTNLSFSGLSVYDGLNILEELKVVPDTLLVELNVVTRRDNFTFTNELFKYPISNLRWNLESLRTKNQVVGLTSKYVTSVIVNFQNIISTKSIVKKKIITRNNIENGVSGELMYSSNYEPIDNSAKGIFQQYSTVDSNGVLMATEYLEERLDFFIRNGSKVIFFEMPVNRYCAELPFPSFNRSVIRNIFSADKDYSFIERDTSEYLSTDGVHLSPLEAQRYTQFLSGQIKGVKQ